MTDTVLPYLTAILRMGLVAAATGLVSNGLLAEDRSGQFVDQATGLALLAITAAWSLWQKRRTAAHIEAAAAAEPGAPVKGTPL
jgi:ABC-type nickel/cobalt efflux system permease component RcnA